MQYLKITPGWLHLFIVVMLVVGIFFRFFHLDYKLFWHDEVYTSFRAAGFTGQEISQEIFQNQIISPQDLQKYQRPKLGSNLVDTIESLAVEDPQHPPLYFLIARFWMQFFGGSITASRTLPALLSLISLPLMYGLGIELFRSNLAAGLATAFLALSPFDILFAQIARQYSFLTVCIIGSSFLLLRALRLPTWYNWVLYMLTTTFGFYSQPFFGLTVLGHTVYILIEQAFKFKITVNNGRKFDIKKIIFFGLAIAGSIILYSPWLYVLKTNYQRVLATTNWAQGGDIVYLVKLWILSFTALFLDLDFGFDSIWTYALRLPILVMIFFAIYVVYRRTNPTTWLFIITAIFVPFLMLAVPDFLVGTRRSAVSRYLISCFPGVQLAVAYLLATNLQNGRRFWRGVIVMLAACSIASSTVSAVSDTWWSNIPSYFNAEISRRINGVAAPILVSDAGNDGTNLGDLISLSYLLDKDVQLLLLSQPPQLEALNVKSLFLRKSQPFFFRPSQKLVKAVESQQGKLVPIVPGGGLWELQQ